MAYPSAWEQIMWLINEGKLLHPDGTFVSGRDPAHQLATTASVMDTVTTAVSTAQLGGVAGIDGGIF